MSDWPGDGDVPTTEEVRENFMNGTWDDGRGVYDTGGHFDAWLAEHDAEVRAEVIDWIDRTISNDLRGPAVAIIARQHFGLPQKGAGGE